MKLIDNFFNEKIMKRIYKSLLPLLMCVLIFNALSCNDKEDLSETDNWFSKDLTFHLYVCNNDSVNLLTDTINRKQYIDNMAVVIKGTAYKCELFWESNLITGIYKHWPDGYKYDGGRPRLHFLSMISSEGNEAFFIFEDYAYGDKWSGKKFTIDWGDGTTDEISYIVKSDSWCINGEPVKPEDHIGHPLFYLKK